MESPADQVRVRPATTDDIIPLAGLLSILFAQEADFTPDPEKQRSGLRLILGQPETGRIFCAVADGSIVGMVSLLFSVSTVEGGRVAWLEDMIVHPGWRGRGIGDRLLQQATTAARDAGCKRIILLTDNHNSPAVGFYSKAGFIPSGMIPFRLKL